MSFVYTKTGVTAAGTAGRDAELKYVGEKNSAKLSFSIAVGKEADGSAKWLSCVAWWHIAEYGAGLNIKKGDTVFVIGSMASRTWENAQGETKTFTDLNVDYLSVIPKQHLRTEARQTTSEYTAPAFVEVNDVDDEDLPF